MRWWAGDGDEDGEPGDPAAALAALRNASDDELSAWLDSVSNDDVVFGKNFITGWTENDSDAQRFANAIGDHGRPTVETDEDAFDRMADNNGLTMYRTVNTTHTSFGTVTAGEIVNQWMTGAQYVGDGRIGDGHYFAANSYASSASYGNRRNSADTLIFKATLKPNAKVVDAITLSREYVTWAKKHPKSARVLFGGKKSWDDSHLFQFAKLRGYDAISDSSDYKAYGNYINVVNREAVVVYAKAQKTNRHNAW